MAGTGNPRRGVDRSRHLRRKRSPHLPRRRWSLEGVQGRRPGHARGLSQRSAPGVGVVQLAARTDREGAAQRGAQGARATGNQEARVHPDHAERGWPARSGGQRPHAQAARRYLAHAVHGVRRQLAGPARAAAQDPAALRLRRAGAPRRGLVRRAASRRHDEGSRARGRRRRSIPGDRHIGGGLPGGLAWCPMRSRAAPRSSRSTPTIHRSPIWWTAPCAVRRANCCRSSWPKSPLSCPPR